MKHTLIRSRPRAMVLTAAALLLVGCGSTYEVTVRNDGSRTVRARMTHNPLLSPVRTLGAGTVAPGSSVEWLAKGIDPFDPVKIEVMAGGDTQGLPETIDLPKGRSTIVIDDAGATSWSGFSLRIER
jgi:hypothetical protein